MAIFTGWISRILTSFNSHGADVTPVGIVLKNADDSPDVLGSNGSGALKTSTASTAAALGAVVTVSAKAQFASQACQTGVLIQAELANTGICSIGDSTLTTSNGIQLQAGDSAFVPVSNVNLLYSIGTVLTDKLRVLAL